MIESLKIAGIVAAACAALAALASCETFGHLPDKVEDMDCALLARYADHEADKHETAFFLSQLQFPADWRRIPSDRPHESFWLEAGSLKRLQNASGEIYQITGLSSVPEKGQFRYRIQVDPAQCKGPKAGTLKFLNRTFDSPSPFTFTEKFDLKGNFRNDRIARILCGFEALPDLDKTEQMAQKWSRCNAESASK